MIGKERDDHRGEDEVPSRGECTDEGVDGDRQWRLVRAVEVDQREEEVVPDDEAGEDRDRARHRAQQREDDLPERPQRGRAVDARRLLVLLRQGQHEARVEEDRERHPDARVEEDDPEVRPDEPEIAHDGVRRDEAELEREDDREHEEEVERRAHASRPSGDRVRADRADRDQREHAPAGDDEAVGQRAAERGVVPCRAEVGEVQLVRERERRLERLDVRLHRDHHQEVERDHPEDRDDDQEGLARERPPRVAAHQSRRSRARRTTSCATASTVISTVSTSESAVP